MGAQSGVKFIRKLCQEICSTCTIRALGRFQFSRGNQNAVGNEAISRCHKQLSEATDSTELD